MNTPPWIKEYELLSGISKNYHLRAPHIWDNEDFWSFGDVESNHIYYHPTLTHYAHKTFESYFFKKKNIHYSDLSREGDDASLKRFTILKDKKPLTFPIIALFQEMYFTMSAGNKFKMKILCNKIDDEKLGVVCLTYNEDNLKCASIMWLRSAVSLAEDKRTNIKIPDWFPFK